MKTIFFLIFLFYFCFGFNIINAKEKNFTSNQDTLVLTTKKLKGFWKLPAGAGTIQFKDTTERSYSDTTLHYGYPMKFPTNISDIKCAWHVIDFSRLKTLNIKDNSIGIMCGRIGNDKIFIVDENNNKDFRDDSVRPYRKMDWFTTTRLIKCKYKIFKGNELVKDSSWINIGKSDDGDLLFFVSHHLESSFSLNNQSYRVGIVSSQSNFGFDNIVDKPILALMSTNGVRKDTLLESELINKGEYLKLGNGYYRFDHVTNDGEYITLVKEKDFNSKIGTQVGMISPDFVCRSMDGDSISYKKYKGKYLLLINVSACWSPVSSYKCYKDLTTSCKGKFEYLCFDNSPNFLRQNIKELNLTGKFVIAEENDMIRRNFRRDYCSRTCFLINPEGRIIDKFEIFDWKSNLANLLSNKY